jgi:hypothetical protein
MKHPHLGAKKRVNSRRDVHELWRSSHQMSFASRLSFIIDLPLIELGDAQLPESIASLSHPHRCAFVFGSPDMDHTRGQENMGLWQEHKGIVNESV